MLWSIYTFQAFQSDHILFRLFYRRIRPAKSHITLCACNEVSIAGVKLIQTGEVNVSFIHDIEASLFIAQFVQHVYVMYFSIGYQYDCQHGSLTLYNESIQIVTLEKCITV